MSDFEWYRQRAGAVPDETCPAIDTIIDDLNAVRKANAQLRELAHHWRDAAEDLGRQIDSMQDEFDRLKAERDELVGELRELERGAAA